MIPIAVGSTRATSGGNLGRPLEPRAYQSRIAAWALDEAPEGKGLEAVDLGLGKTAAALMTLQASLWDRFDTQRWLVVAPKLVAIDTWPTQLQTWGEFKHLDWRVIGAEHYELTPGLVVATGELDADGLPVELTMTREQARALPSSAKVLAKSGLLFRDKAKVKRALQQLREPLHIVSWDFFPFLVQAYGANWPYDGLILDESTFAQSSTGLRHKAAWQVIQRLRAVGRVIELSGLPTPNGRDALHGQIRLLDGGKRLGKGKGEFAAAWMVPARMDKRTNRVWSWKVNPALVSDMDARISDICVSLDSADYLSLPDVVPNDIPVTLPMPARQAYAALERDLVAKVGESGLEVVAASQGVLIGKLMQVCSGAVYTSATTRAWSRIHDAKLDVLAELIEAATEPLIVVYQYEHEYERLRERFKGIRDVTQRGVLTDFKSGKVAHMCGHPASFGHGVDGLQDVCHQVLWFGATYNLEHWLQVLKRIHRNGQVRPVILTRLLAVDTLEENIAREVLPDKRITSDVLLSAVRLRVGGANVSPTFR